MVKHKAWATNILVPKQMGSMTTKGQLKPTFKVNLMESQAGGNSQDSCYLIQYSERSDLWQSSSEEINEEEQHCLDPTIESAEQQRHSSVSKFKIDTHCTTPFVYTKVIQTFTEVQ